IKILHSHLLAGELGEELEARFKHEVKAAARCQHPNIVTVFDYGFSDGSPYMVMEYVKGVDLQVFLKSGHLLTANQAINLILKVLDALHAAHSMGVVHRDIKPANIMILDNGQVKVTDFGVARIDTSELTQIGDVMGTPCYMSPEAREGKRTNHLSDLYTTALVLVELLIKKRLKTEQRDYLNLLAELNQQQIEPNLAAELAALLNTALQVKPQQRYQDALSFYKALSNCLGANDYAEVDDLAATVLNVITKVNTKNPAAELQTNPSSNVSILASKSEAVQTQLTQVERNLTSYLGPVAKMLVKKQAKKSDNIAQLLDSLVKYIPSDRERQKFIDSLESSGISKAGGSKSGTEKADLSPEYIAKLTSELAYYVGPIAKHLMKSTLKKAASKEDLQTRLADKIPNEEERSQFIKNCEKS
ncbi:MAG: protein kinase, partial [Methylococcaceae bacterium]|nr:protein kinase [Methylococcaceae bacterium]